MNMNRKRRKNRRLKITTWIAGVGAIMSACCLDSDSYIPIAVCAVCTLWLSLFAIANSEW